MKKKWFKSAAELRFEELAALVLRLEQEKCRAMDIMAHFVSGNLDLTLLKLEAAGYWPSDDECSIEERRDRRLYSKPWYILGKYMEDLRRLLKPHVDLPVMSKAYQRDYPLRDEPKSVPGMTAHR